jgi:hypothetical protein
MNYSQIENWLKSEGFKTENGKYYQKTSKNGWYVDVVVEPQNKAQVYALHESQTKHGGPIRAGFNVYDYITTNHKLFKIKGIKATKNYVRNKEGFSFPLYIIPMAVETIENRLENSKNNRIFVKS